ncbi:MAG: hypothetical protein MK102_06810 [Fuerstiella sp.]|nr:hypothetical protein [Fuerstiella sp.]
MNLTRRGLLQQAALASTAVGVTPIAAADDLNRRPARRPRTIYFNDARHYYLYVFDPPMNLVDAWRPIDEVAGTAIDTFVYGVERGDGLFYPSKVGMRFGEDKRPFNFAAYWRAWQNIQSLMDQGLDPLKVLIDRAHQKDMEFIASLRMSSYGGIKSEFKVPEGGRGMAHQEVRDHQLAVLRELATDYDVEGLELDFAAAPGGMPPILRNEDTSEFTPVLTSYVAQIAEMVRSRTDRILQLGARVYPTEKMNLAQGLDVRSWLRQGLVDYVVPMFYLDFTLDPDMPFDWLVDAAHQKDVSVYGMLAPYVANEQTGSPVPVHADPEHLRAAAANYRNRDVDGLYTWFMKWPLGDAERRALTELGDADLITEADKHYILHRRSAQAAELGYDADLPLKIESADPGKRYKIPFSIADDVEQSAGRIRGIQLRISIENLVTDDRLSIRLNGKSLATESCRRDFNNSVSPYEGQQLAFELNSVLPRTGPNVLDLSLDSRPDGLEGGVTIESVELLIEYGPYPSVLNRTSG